MKRCTANKWEFVSGMGTFFFTKDDKIVHTGNEHELPKSLKECVEFTDDYCFICGYINTTIGVDDE